MPSLHRTIFRSAGVLALTFAGGCMSQGVKAEHDKLSLIQPGVTTRAQIEQSFGPPDMVDPVGDHQVMIYSHLKAQPNALCFLGSLDYERQSYQFVLNKKGDVEAYDIKEFKGSSGIFDATVKETAADAAPAK